MGTRAVSAPLWCPLSKQGVLSLSMLQGMFEGRSEGPQGFVAAAGFRSWRLESRGSEMLGGEGPLLSKGQGGYQAICEWSRSEAENRRKIDLPAEARSVPSRPLMNVTITG